MIPLLDQEQGRVILLPNQEQGCDAPSGSGSRKPQVSPDSEKDCQPKQGQRSGSKPSWSPVHAGLLNQYPEAFVSMVRNTAGPPGATAGVKV